MTPEEIRAYNQGLDDAKRAVTNQQSLTLALRKATQRIEELKKVVPDGE